MELPVFKHLKVLAEEIGERPLGSLANLHAAEYIRSQFAASGLEVEMQSFDCPLWEHLGTQLTRVGEPLQAAANPFSPPVDITAPILPIGTRRELQEAHLAGRIGILYGELMPGAGLGCRHGFYYPESDQQIVALLEEKHPAALITVHPRANTLARMVHDWEFHIPSASVCGSVGARFILDGRPLHIKIRSTSAPGSFANVVGRRGQAARRIIVCAHFDTAMETPGAVDNGSGSAVLLTVAEELKALPAEVSIEFLALNGEENGGVGVAEYLRRCDPSPSEIIAVINLDGVAQVAGVNSITMMDETPAVRLALDRMMANYPSVAWVDPWYESDHTAFAARQVPSIAMSTAGIIDINHTPLDTCEWIAPHRMCEVVDMVENLVIGLAAA